MVLTPLKFYICQTPGQDCLRQGRHTGAVVSKPTARQNKGRLWSPGGPAPAHLPAGRKIAVPARARALSRIPASRYSQHIAERKYAVPGCRDKSTSLSI